MRWLGDRYLRIGGPRPLGEVEASARARALDIPTPAVVAAAWYPTGLLYRADLITEWIPDAYDLADIIFGDAAGPAAEEVLLATGRLIRLAAERGLQHPDLNATNVLVSIDGTRLWLLDLDGAQVRESPRASAGRQMLDRLRRSLAKWERRSGRVLHSTAHAALSQGFRGTS